MSSARRFGLSSLAVAVFLAGVGAQVTQSPVVGASPAIAAEPDDQAAGPLVRPDSISAMVTAQASGERVEDLSQGDAYNKVFAEPDGSWTSETAAEPVRAKDQAGEWAPIDLTLVKSGGRLIPTNALGDASFSAGGDQVLARADAERADSAGALAWRWPSELPEPVVDGATATYEDAVPGGGDLVVIATATGFTHNIVLHEAPVTADTDLPEDGGAGASEGSGDGEANPGAPATDAAPEPSADEPATSVEYVVPVITPGAEIERTTDGSLEVTDNATGDTVASAPAPLMWDASGDPTSTGTGQGTGKTGPEDPTVAPVDTTVVNTPAGGRVVLTPDVEFLTDPDTVYPVTIDPSFSLVANADTWVMNTGYTSSQSTSIELRAGTYDDGTHLARTFMKFPGDNLWANKQIRGASLVMRNFSSTSCSDGAIRASRIVESWSSTSITWANQPSASTSDAGQYSNAHGFSSSCPQADATFSLTDMVQNWANGTANHGVRLSAVTETNPNSWRRYRSTEYTTESYHPTIVVNYNNYPSTASSLSATPLMSWQPPGGSTTTYYSSSQTPTVSAIATDADGGQLQLRMEARSAADGASTLLGACNTPLGAQGTRLSCKLPTMTNNTTIYVRGKARDSLGAWAGKTQASANGWSSWRPINITAAAPTAPVVSCPTPHDNGTWQETGPSADVTCTISATGSGLAAPGYIRWTLAGSTGAGEETRVKITPSSSPATAKITVTVPKELGSYQLQARAENRAGKISTTTEYGFGYGPFTIKSPTPTTEANTGGRAMVTTTDRLTIVAEGPTNTHSSPEPTIKWRVAGSGGNATTGWHDAGVTDYQVDTPSTGKSSLTAVVDTRSFDDGTGGPNPRRPVMLELQVCMPYPSTEACTWSNAPVTVLRVPHAFGGNYPTDVAGPGEVALWTGEFGLAETDATEPGYLTELGVSRSHGSFGGPAEDLDGGPAGVFGPGWTAALDGPGTGLTDATLIDSTPYDGTLALMDTAGDVLVWSKSAPASRRTTTNLPADGWVAADEETRLSDVKLNVSGTGANTTVQITDSDGVVTTFKAIAAVTGAGEYEFTPDSVQDPTATGAAGKTTFLHDSDGRVTRVLSPVPNGVTCPDTGTLPAGCHALKLTYGTSGNSNDRLTEIHVIHGSTVTLVSSYVYDAEGRLIEVTDERADLTTTYTWDGSSRRLASYTPPGLKTVRFDYNDDHKLVEIARDNPTGSGTTTISQIRYGIPVDDSGSTDPSALGLPVLGEASVSVWDQAAVPTYGAAVFPQGSPTVDANSVNITSGQWKHAGLTYTDPDGRTLNTAEYGMSRWLMSATDYDENDNVTRELSEGDIAAIQDGRVAAADAGTLYVYDPVKNAANTVTIPAGVVVTETFGPARDAVITNAGGLNSETAWVRPHTITTYDEGAPNNGINPVTGTAYGLETRSITRPWDPATGADITGSGTILAEDRTGYAALETGDKTGWELGAPTTSTTVMASSDITTATRYDNEGRVIEERQPSSNGTDAGTRRTIYYSAEANSADAACGNKPEWAGLVCVTKYAGGDLPVDRVTSYTIEAQPLEITQSVGGTLRRTTTNTYDAKGRAAKSWTKTHGMPGSTATTGTSTAYDETTGFETAVSSVDNTGAVINDKTITTGYDAWGRTTTYAVTDGTVTETTSTSYNAAGDAAQVEDLRGTTTYTYDGTDADGNEEHRGVVTKVVTSRPSANPVEFTGAYNADETLITHKMPGGITQHTELNAAGDPVTMVYTGRVNTVDPANPDGAPVPTDNVPWVGWTQTNDIFGRTRAEWTPEGAAYAGALNGDAAAGYARGYTYDRAGRLTEVVDHASPNGSGTTSIEDGVLTVPNGTVCETRTYAFDSNGNRTALTRKGADATGACLTTGAPPRTWGWDAADRPTNAGYVRDDLGRITTLPANDTPTGTGNIELAYYDSDSIQSINQGSQTSTYTLDTAGRRVVESSSTPDETVQVDHHYTDGSDVPGWSRNTITTSSGESIGTTRYVENLGGDVAATLNSQGTSAATAADLSLAIANPHGDIVGTVQLPATGAAAGIDGWATYDEYGSTATTAKALPLADSGIAYGWVGSHQRATQPHGLILMGARVYTPVSGQFTSRDPIFGGNTTAYAYPQDPVNGFDLTGLMVVDGKSGPGRALSTKERRRLEFLRLTRNGPVPLQHSGGAVYPPGAGAGEFFRGKKNGKKGTTKAGDRRAKNSGKYYSSRDKAERAAKKYAGKRKGCKFRGLCDDRDHYHVDRRLPRKGNHTRHFYFPYF